MIPKILTNIDASYYLKLKIESYEKIISHYYIGIIL